jgi:hypothetical protein
MILIFSSNSNIAAYARKQLKATASATVFTIKSATSRDFCRQGEGGHKSLLVEYGHQNNRQ